MAVLDCFLTPHLCFQTSSVPFHPAKFLLDYHKGKPIRQTPVSEKRLAVFFPWQWSGRHVTGLDCVCSKLWQPGCGFSKTPLRACMHLPRDSGSIPDFGKRSLLYLLLSSFSCLQTHASCSVLRCLKPVKWVLLPAWILNDIDLTMSRHKLPCSSAFRFLFCFCF